MPCRRPSYGPTGRCAGGRAGPPCRMMSRPMSSALRKEYLAALGLQTWTLRRPAAASEPVAAPFNESAPVAAAVPRESARRDELAPGDAAAPHEAALREAAYDWPQLRERVAACTRCGLSATRTQ